jgi:hypothetical protein
MKSEYQEGPDARENFAGFPDAAIAISAVRRNRLATCSLRLFVELFKRLATLSFPRCKAVRASAVYNDPPLFDLPLQRTKVPLHPVDADSQAAFEWEVLRMLREHGRIHAWDTNDNFEFERTIGYRI